MFKYEIGQTVWYIKDNCVHSAKVGARVNQEVDPEFQKLLRAGNPWGDNKLLYGTVHGNWREDQIHRSVDDLLYALKEKIIAG